MKRNDIHKVRYFGISWSGKKITTVEEDEFNGLEDYGYQHKQLIYPILYFYCSSKCFCCVYGRLKFYFLRSIMMQFMHKC